MTATSRMQRGVRPPHQTATHLFKVGQTVRLTGGFMKAAQPTEIYIITAALPPVGNSPQYRIRNEEERHERVTTQDSLEAIITPLQGAGETLIERTFGQSKGAEASELRDPETQAL